MAAALDWSMLSEFQPCGCWLRVLLIHNQLLDQSFICFTFCLRQSSGEKSSIVEDWALPRLACMGILEESIIRQCFYVMYTTLLGNNHNNVASL